MSCLYGGFTQKLCNNYFDCGVCYAKSFASHEKSIYWNYEKNEGLTPRDVFLNSGKKMWFTCEKCKHEFKTGLCYITKGTWCSYCSDPPKKLCDEDNCNFCLEKSFASHPRAKFWNYEENKGLTPRDVFLNSNKKFWFTCGECNHKFKIALNHANSNKWCPYCVNLKLCDKDDCKFCFNKSFASHPRAKFWNYEENGNIKPRDITLNTHKKFWFYCLECNHKFNLNPHNISQENAWCQYCSNPPKKLCNKDDCKFCFSKSFASHPRAKFWNYEENGDVQPRDVFLNSNNKYCFTCEECNNNFKTTLSNINRGNQCPYCKNKTEKMFADWLTDEKIPFEREKKFDWCINLETDRHFPFDFYLPNHKVIIEIDGRQHVEQVDHFKNDLQTIQERDNYKETLAIENGIHVIRICQEDIFHNRIDWEKEVLERLEEIKNKEPEIFCLHSGGFYEV